LRISKTDPENLIAVTIFIIKIRRQLGPNVQVATEVRRRFMKRAYLTCRRVSSATESDYHINEGDKSNMTASVV
jgi:hypothetical protein